MCMLMSLLRKCYRVFGKKKTKRATEYETKNKTKINIKNCDSIMYQEYLNQLQSSLFPMSSEQLKELLNNDDKLDDKVDEVLESLKTQKVRVFEENRNRAEKNIEKEPQIIELRSKLAELTEEGRNSCAAVQDLLTQIQAKSGGANQETALALLQTNASESEEKTEECVKKFTDNEINVDTFLDEFLSSRRTMHLRKLKAEKMQELIRKQSSAASQRHSNIPAYGNLPGTGGSGFYQSGNVPYPMMGPMMPMPPPSRPY
ncbi:vacuolar protein sorting-associated protein 37B [Drosophila innubila]|uniref:vacuolar protein sorting-associated protein 37B n=1 Tax=Drosophila innubila TaxID=198719 RepID=UPI00148E5130|nr:vacuolar protein sorting-associated protein 37B [Drosophila innubila]